MSIETILDRNEAWIKEFDQYADQQKAPLLYIDMQSPSVNQLFAELSDRLTREKRVFLHQHLRNAVPDIASEKEMLQAYLHTLQSESTSPLTPKTKSRSFTTLCVPQTHIKIEPMLHAYHIDRINRQLAYYE
jgi:hypothetical protein